MALERNDMWMAQGLVDVNGNDIGPANSTKSQPRRHRVLSGPSIGGICVEVDTSSSESETCPNQHTDGQASSCVQHESLTTDNQMEQSIPTSGVEMKGCSEPYHIIMSTQFSMAQLHAAHRSSESLSSMSLVTSTESDASPKFYSVRRGWFTGVFTSRLAAHHLVQGFSRGNFKSFQSKRDAVEDYQLLKTNNANSLV
ncbi:hypothetical protein DFJ58DRAFT_844206 [Suillus subalutaceus]|uniref:uncharacterized protein n=1 Tax=Suillus subalutaceus TaxID=48586 RepID=UPI001B865020|nr:uncharacterized protein DFJ58DRAFT_844206 [Suillus subalutaceus]KAG1843780.1 hypothetical protein DFJ58DRAFT_844206 [Suillus subalutaceus]